MSDITARPELVRVEAAGCAIWTDPEMLDAGIALGFAERTGGVSAAPYASLNCAGHVGDLPGAVNENRRRVMAAFGVEQWRDRLTMGHSNHGDNLALVSTRDAGAGAFIGAGATPVEAVDCLITQERELPLMQTAADCVPFVMLAPGPTVAFVHAGWRGALLGLPGKAAAEVARVAGVSAGQVRVYIGAHIGACHYAVSDDLLSQFVNAFGTFARAESGGLDLDAVVSASLSNVGVARCNIARLGACTAETTDRFFSYRAEGGVTGRHAALVCIL